MKQTLEKDHEKIVWHAPEFEYIHKDLEWYWTTLIASAVLFLIAIWQQDLLFAIFIVIAEALFIHWAREYPRTLKFMIDDRGIEIGHIKSYTYVHLSGFHILTHSDHGELILRTKTRLHPYTRIIVVKEDIPDIKAFLRRHLPEIEYEESLSDHFGRMIGF
ncbi:hypothetical protein KGO95_03455 [Patescibacteria group bacterium]|nr:hypothetical protein [Patescibacteria group bacterium]